MLRVLFGVFVEKAGVCSVEERCRQWGLLKSYDEQLCWLSQEGGRCYTVPASTDKLVCANYLGFSICLGVKLCNYRWILN